MSILSVSLPSDLEKFISDEVASGEFESKSQLVKKALRKFEEDLIVERLLRSSREAKEGKVFRGDLRELVKKIK
jgi:putative addiction module CopG family antidote